MYGWSEYNLLVLFCHVGSCDRFELRFAGFKQELSYAELSHWPLICIFNHHFKESFKDKDTFLSLAEGSFAVFENEP